jgi:hypothetical protein
MNQNNLYKEEGDEEEESEEEEEEEESEDKEESDEDVEDSVVDFGDILKGTHGVNFHSTGNFLNLNSNHDHQTFKTPITIVNEFNDNNKYQKDNLDLSSNSSKLICNDIINNYNELQIPYQDPIDKADGVSNNENDKSEFQIKNKIEMLDLDLESMPKDELINLLLKEEVTPEKKNKKCKINARPKPITNNIYSNMQQMNDNKDPELAQDFNVALTKVLSKMMKDPNNSNQEVFDILLADREIIEEELQKVNK